MAQYTALLTARKDSPYHAVQSFSIVGVMAHETFGERLRRLRTAKGLTMTQLGYKVGVTEGAIRQMESGQSKSASFQVGVRLAQVLGVGPTYLALGEGPMQPAAETEGSSQNAETLALGGLSLVQELRTMRQQLEELQAWKSSFEAPPKKRARR